MKMLCIPAVLDASSTLIVPTELDFRLHRDSGKAAFPGTEADLSKIEIFRRAGCCCRALILCYVSLHHSGCTVSAGTSSTVHTGTTPPRLVAEYRPHLNRVEFGTEVPELYFQLFSRLHAF